MIPFDYLDDAEEWMDKNSSGSVCVLIKVIRSKACQEEEESYITTRWVLEWSKESAKE